MARRASAARAPAAVHHEIRCPVCGRTFTRQTDDARMRPHTAQAGDVLDCIGSDADGVAVTAGATT